MSVNTLQEYIYPHTYYSRVIFPVFNLTSTIFSFIIIFFDVSTISLLLIEEAIGDGQLQMWWKAGIFLSCAVIFFCAMCLCKMGFGLLHELFSLLPSWHEFFLCCFSLHGLIWLVPPPHPSPSLFWSILQQVWAAERHVWQLKLEVFIGE